MTDAKVPPTEDAVRAALRTVDDPEVGMNVVDLGNAVSILVFVVSTLTAVVRGKRAARERLAQA